MRLLLVEDDAALADLLRRALEPDGYAVDVAGSVEDGHWLAAEVPYDVAVIDIGLPDGDGVDLVRALRSEERWTPVLVLTARQAIAERIRGLDAGADDFLVKPFSLDELRARLRAVARRGAAPRPTAIRAGRLTIDPALRVASVDGVRLPASGRALTVLALLAGRAGAVVSRTEILEHGWDWAFEGTSNIVDVYIRQLRVQLAACPGAPVIETVRGEGYRLVADPGTVPGAAERGGGEPAP
ncbi:MAG: response regulator transcription factor [Chloroflexota bacterium]